MTSRDFTADATRVLRGAFDHLPEAEPASREREEATIRAIGEAIRARARRRTMRRVQLASLSVAAVVLLGAGAFFARGNVARHTVAAWSATGQGALYTRAARGGARMGVNLPVTGDRTGVDAGARLVAGVAESIQLEATTGTRMALQGEMLVVEEGSRNVFELARGRVSAKVAKLAPAERFLIRTTDAEIEVRGTAFELSLAPVKRCGTATRLQVSEGLVAVRHDGVETLVGAGESWPRCEELAAVEATPPSRVVESAPTVDTRAAARAAVAPAKLTARPQASVTSASTTLAKQNDMFAEAMAFKRQGSPPAAVAKLDKLILEYPAGPLLESATVERMKLLDGTDHERGRAAARDYVSRWPTGFARADADRILARP